MPVEQSFRQFKKNIFRTTYSSIRYLSREEAIRICQFCVHEQLHLFNILDVSFKKCLVYLFLKTYFSLICSFLLLLIVRWLSPKIIWQITFWRLVAYKPFAYKEVSVFLKNNQRPITKHRRPSIKTKEIYGNVNFCKKKRIPFIQMPLSGYFFVFHDESVSTELIDYSVTFYTITPKNARVDWKTSNWEADMTSSWLKKWSKTDKAWCRKVT